MLKELYISIKSIHDSLDAQFIAVEFKEDCSASDFCLKFIQTTCKSLRKFLPTEDQNLMNLYLET